MRLMRGGPARGRIVSVATLCVIAGLTASCSASSPATATAPATGTSPVTATSPAAGTPSTATSRSANAAVVFTVRGTNPVTPNGSQDTYATTPDAVCDSGTLTADEAVGTEVVDGFSVAGFPVAADLLSHFLKGKGTEIDYRPGSPISKEASASSAFRTLNEEVLREIVLQLKAGDTRVRLSAAQLPTVAFESTGSDLYWGFRGTQGVSVTGNGGRKNGRYAGTLTYVIRDSYGFPADDTLEGFGPPMRYLQTMCGAPPHAGGAHWFPDTITVTVPFSRTA
jgi:hypothetical protein